MIVTVTIQKGGTMKTSLTYNMAYRLADKGYRVLTVDLDPQHNLSHTFDIDELFPLDDVLIGKTDIDKAIVKKADKIDVLPCDRSLYNLQLNLKPTILKNVLADVEKEYDFILIDTPPALSSLTINALVASDKVVIPAIQGEYCDLAIKDVIKTIEAVKSEYNPDLAIDGILMTMTHPRTTLSKLMAENFADIAEKSNTRVYQAQIRYCNAIKEAQYVKESIFEYSPRSNGSKDIDAFLKEFLGDVK